jgi:hypothetical protein
VTSPGLLSYLVSDDTFHGHDLDVVAETLGIEDAALLHRDPPAELSRLRTRGFVVGALKEWLLPTGELCARVVLYRFIADVEARLAAADVRSELGAGAATIIAHDNLQMAVVHEDEITHVISVQSSNDTVILVSVSGPDVDPLLSNAKFLALSQLRLLAER